jgi:hypothetical protein
MRWCCALRWASNSWPISNAGEINLSAYTLLRPHGPPPRLPGGRHWWELWATPGALAVAQDRGSQTMDVGACGDCAQRSACNTFDVTGLVSYWLTYPDANHGMLIEGDPAMAKGVYFASADYYDATSDPSCACSMGWPWPRRRHSHPPPSRSRRPRRRRYPHRHADVATPTPTQVALRIPLVYR